MAGEAIPRERWDAFCARLAAERREDDVAVELEGAGCHALVQHARLLALRVVDATTGVRFEVETRPVAGGEGDRSAFALIAPSHIAFERPGGDRGRAALRAVGSDGATLRVRFSGGC